jgi:hypothetical protein
MAEAMNGKELRQLREGAQHYNQVVPRLLATIDHLEEALHEHRDKWSFNTLVLCAERCLERYYPPGTIVSEGDDAGPQLVKALRRVLGELNEAHK